jgi:excisionase family DNA binding protein
MARRRHIERVMLSVPEVARRWGCSQEKVMAMIGRGELRAYNFGNNPSATRVRLSIKIDDVLAYEAKQTPHEQPPP